MFVSSCLCLKYFSEGRAIEKKNRLRKFKIAHRGNFKNLLKLLLVARIQHRLILHLGCKLPWLCLRNNSRKNEGMGPKQKQYPVVDGTDDRSKVWCCKEQYCIGTWNVRSINQGKLEVIKQEMAKVNVDILGISELRWTGMNSPDGLVNLTQMTLISTIVGRNPLEEMD